MPTLYKNQVILSLQGPSANELPHRFPRRGGTAEMLTEKVTARKLTTKTVFLNGEKNPENYAEHLKDSITRRTRLYIIGHGPQNDPNIILGTDSNDQDHAWSPEELACLIAKNFTRSTLKDYSIGQKKPKLLISLVRCYSGDGNQNSFAARLSDALYKLDIEADIYGRKGTVSRYNGLVNKKYVNGHHHQNGSKILISRNAHGKLQIFPVVYSQLKKLNFLAEVTNMPRTIWTFNKSFQNFCTPEEKGTFWKKKQTQLKKKYPELDFKIAPSITQKDFFRLTISEQNLTEYLNKNTAPEIVDSVMDSDLDILAFLKLLTPNIDWQPRGECQFVTALNSDIEAIRKIHETLLEKYPSLDAELLESRDINNKGRFRIVVPVINILNLMSEIKNEQFRQLNDSLKDQYPAAKKIMQEFFATQTFKERFETLQDLKTKLGEYLTQGCKDQILEFTEKSFTIDFQETSTMCSLRLSQSADSTQSAPSNEAAITSAQSDADHQKLITNPTDADSNSESDETLSESPNSASSLPTFELSVSQSPSAKPFSGNKAQREPPRNNIPTLFSKSSSESPVDNKSDQRIETDTEKKFTHLLKLKEKVMIADWHTKGRNFFGFWNKIPDGIVNLRNILKDLPPVYSTENDSMIKNKFELTATLLKNKQTPYSGLGKRHKYTCDFYEASWNNLPFKQEEKKQGLEL